MTIYIKYPNGTVKEISFSDPAISFTPASANGNEAVVTFTPEFDTDGYYELQVKGEDVSGNNSGDQSFTVSFRVIMEELISNVFNYPNPFSTSTQFIFTLTGKRVPNYMKIQIMTAGGSIVREIMKDELGPLKIGLNRTDYRWDGTDEYGSKLANGVYFYRVVTKNEDGEAYEKFENGTNSFFKHELGKMVILR
jgi:flagellar hook assembly protein FlgD